MRSQPRRFTVEVKRGTSREAFQSHESSSKFSRAEAMLFSKPQPAVIKRDAVQGAVTMPTGRILPVLSEPEAVIVAEPDTVRRRTAQEAVPDDPEIVESFASPEQRSNEVIDVEPLAPPASPDPKMQASRPDRLRDRSRILKRYVFGTEPKAGQRGRFQTRKAKRLSEANAPR